MRYYVDIDGTICTITDGEYTKAVAYTDRIEKINKLFDQGHQIIYWTARGGNTGKDWTTLTKDQLHRWGAKYTELIMRKPSYDVWIDDKAVNSEVFFK